MQIAATTRSGTNYNVQAEVAGSDDVTHDTQKTTHDHSYLTSSDALVIHSSQGTESTLSLPPNTSMYDVNMLCAEHGYNAVENEPNVMSVSPKTGFRLAMTEMDKLKEERDAFRNKCIELQADINLAKNAPFSYEKIKDSDHLVKLHTGIPSHACFEWLFEQFKSKIPRLQYYRGSKTQDALAYQVSDVMKPGPERMLDSKSEMLLTLMKLRMNLLHEDLAFRFKISVSLVTRILSTWIPFLGLELKKLVQWPKVSDLYDYYPDCFKSVRGLVLAIIDCTEIFTHTPSLPETNSKMYSNYKSHTTVKLLVACGPSGCISFVSKLAGGAMSDKKIVDMSHFLQKVQLSALECDEKLVVLADRGFNITEDLPPNVNLKYPPFTKGKQQFSVKNSCETKVIANARIHIERVIGRLKEFRILQSVLPMDFLDLIDHIVHICSGIVNLQPPIIK